MKSKKERDKERERVGGWSLKREMQVFPEVPYSDVRGRGAGGGEGGGGEQGGGWGERDEDEKEGVWWKRRWCKRKRRM